MEGHAGAEYSAEDYRFVDDVAVSGAQRSFDVLLAVLHDFANLVSHDFAGALKVAAEAQGVAMDSGRAHFEQELAHQRRSLGKVNYFHLVLFFGLGKGSKFLWNEQEKGQSRGSAPCSI